MIFLILLTTLLFSGSPAALSDDSGTFDDTFHVTSDVMVSQQDMAFVEFTGNVVVTRQKEVINADSIKIFIHKKEEKKNNQKQTIKKIIASGNVQYISGNRKALSDNAVYTTGDETLVLTGDSPKVITGDSFVSGEKITLFRKNNKIIVESGQKKRVEAFFNPKDKAQLKKNR